MKLHDIGLTSALLIALVPADTQAQSDFIKDNVSAIIRKVGVHGNISVREPIDPDVTKGMTVGASIGLIPGRTNGWRYPIGFTMLSENLHSPNGQQFGVLSSKAIVAGIGYGWNFGRLATSAAFQTGYAFNRGRVEGDTLSAFGSPDGVSVDVGNSLLLRPRVKAEYFITPKFTFRGSADYVLLRPSIVVTTPTERIANRWDASNFHASVGVGFYPFSK